MQRFIFAITLAFCALCATAQVRADRPADACVYRKGNTYVCQNQVMNKREYRNFLASSGNQPAYERFVSGYRTANAGWGLFSGGLAFGATGLGFLCTGAIRGAHNEGTDFSTGVGTAISSTVLIVYGTIFCAVGGVLEVAAIPTLSIGYARMHNSVDVYNVQCSSSAQPNLYLGIKSDANGIGLALRW